MKTIYYFDMDGVLADFNAEVNAVERFRVEKDFFYNLKPIRANIDYVKAQVEKGNSVKILSKSPNKNADRNKRKWIKKHMPFVKMHNVILIRNEDNKSAYASKTCLNILYDDYGENCKEWHTNARYGIAYKVKGKLSNALLYTMVR